MASDRMERVRKAAAQAKERNRLRREEEAKARVGEGGNMKIRFINTNGYSIGIRVTSKGAIGDALWDDDVNTAIYDQEWEHGLPTMWFGPGVDVDESSGIIVEHNGKEHLIKDVYGQHALIESMGLEYAGDADQAREDFLVETKINLTELGEEHDCIIVFREEQNFGGALEAELDVSAAEAFDPRKLRWEFVSHDYGGIPNQYIYGRQGLAGEGFISNIAYGEHSTRNGKLGEDLTDGYDSIFYADCEGVFSRCVVVARDEYGDWLIDEDLTSEINSAMEG